MIPKGPLLLSAPPCFGSEIGGKNNYRVPQGLLKDDRVPRGAWLKPPVATGVRVCHRPWACSRGSRLDLAKK